MPARHARIEQRPRASARGCCADDALVRTPFSSSTRSATRRTSSTPSAPSREMAAGSNTSSSNQGAFIRSAASERVGVTNRAHVQRLHIVAPLLAANWPVASLAPGGCFRNTSGAKRKYPLYRSFASLRLGMSKAETLGEGDRTLTAPL